MDPKTPKQKISDKMKARSAAITSARQQNSILKENIQAMELEMQLPRTRKKYIKFVVKSEYKRYVILHTPKGLRWFKWLEYFFMARSKRKEVAREMLKIDDPK